MIISHQHRFIFAAVPKTGTHSIRQALREHLSADDIEQVGLFVNKRFPYEDLAAIRHGHLSLEQVRPYLGEEAFGQYFKFAFVRNPYDRFVSYCAFMTRDRDVFERSPQAVMHHFLFVEPPEQHILFQPLDRVNGARRGDYRRYYDAALADAVAVRYAQDLDLFGYTFEGSR